MQELEASLKAKIQEIEENRGNFEYDAASECNEFHDVFQSEIAPLRRAADADLNRIVDEVVEGKLAPVRSILEAQLEASGRKIDDLLIKVAEVHKAIEGVSRSASAISEKIAVSYTAMAKIEEKFTKERSEMQSAKERLIPLVEAAVQAIKEKRCVVGGQREALIQEFGTVASVNWFSEKADELEKRLNIFIASCQSKDVAKSDVEAFRASVARTEEANQQVSFEKGLTPFKDVPTHEWYYGGMLNGYKTGFITQGRPAESVLRQDALLMVLRAAGANGVELTGECFVGPNVSNVSEYARCAVACWVWFRR
ncbi:hypothetical protein HYV58_00265 [Candidatus Peregrinibacteria bacterium]|nr:hypothetical protein [Candidatus Peregrinibacteria bacterium]